MEISAEEKIMYRVMNTLYDSGTPISFKGSMVLKICLMEAGFADDTRHTVDIDGNWYSEAVPSSDQMVDSIQNALDKNDIPLEVSLYRMYGEGRSAGFELREKSTGEILFTMDIDINRPAMPTKIYEVEGVRFRGVAPKQMIADKVSVISTDRVFRRIKDVVDMHYISQVFEFDEEEVRQTIKNSGRQLGDFNGFINSTDALRHSYEKFQFFGGVDKPPFDNVYKGVKSYIECLIREY